MEDDAEDDADELAAWADTIGVGCGTSCAAAGFGCKVALADATLDCGIPLAAATLGCGVVGSGWACPLLTFAPDEVGFLLAFLPLAMILESLNPYERGREANNKDNLNQE
jgi:hypothetical protein